VEFATTMRRYLPAMDSAFAAHGWRLDTRALTGAIDRMEAQAKAFQTARDSTLAASEPPRQVLMRTNAALLRVERAVTRPQGLVGRSWYRNLIYVADEDNGYANMVFPSVNEALRARDQARTARELIDLAARFDQATAALRDARLALLGNGH
jgi:N-acetylated-alpha-linked acidic dipeptidase